MILAGGSGTRFWPASRRSLPKQYLPIGGPRPLIAETLASFQGPRAARAHAGGQRRRAGRGPRASTAFPATREPAPQLRARNTAASVAWAALDLLQRLRAGGAARRPCDPARRAAGQPARGPGGGLGGAPRPLHPPHPAGHGLRLHRVGSRTGAPRRPGRAPRAALRGKARAGTGPAVPRLGFCGMRASSPGAPDSIRPPGDPSPPLPPWRACRRPWAAAISPRASRRCPASPSTWPCWTRGRRAHAAHRLLLERRRGLELPGRRGLVEPDAAGNRRSGGAELSVWMPPTTSFTATRARSWP